MSNIKLKNKIASVATYLQLKAVTAWVVIICAPEAEKK